MFIASFETFWSSGFWATQDCKAAGMYKTEVNPTFITASPPSSIYSLPIIYLFIYHFVYLLRRFDILTKVVTRSSIFWDIYTDVSEQHISSIFRTEAQDEASSKHNNKPTLSQQVVFLESLMPSSLLAHSTTLKMEAVFSSETSVYCH
jgi:hypothetical protein